MTTPAEDKERFAELPFSPSKQPAQTDLAKSVEKSILENPSASILGDPAIGDFVAEFMIAGALEEIASLQQTVKEEFAPSSPQKNPKPIEPSPKAPLKEKETEVKPVAKLGILKSNRTLAMQIRKLLPDDNRAALVEITPLGTVIESLRANAPLMTRYQIQVKDAGGALIRRFEVTDDGKISQKRILHHLKQLQNPTESHSQLIGGPEKGSRFSMKSARGIFSSLLSKVFTSTPKRSAG